MTERPGNLCFYFHAFHRCKMEEGKALNASQRETRAIEQAGNPCLKQIHNSGEKHKILQQLPVGNRNGDEEGLVFIQLLNIFSNVIVCAGCISKGETKATTFEQLSVVCQEDCHLRLVLRDGSSAKTSRFRSEFETQYCL